MANLFQIGCLINIGFDPLRLYKPGLVKYRVGEVAALKSTAYKGCCPENHLLQAAICKVGINKNRGWETDKGVVFILKPAGLPP